jgi:hypothetical protein
LGSDRHGYRIESVSLEDSLAKRELERRQGNAKQRFKLSGGHWSGCHRPGC